MYACSGGFKNAFIHHLDHTLGGQVAQSGQLHQGKLLFLVRDPTLINFYDVVFNGHNLVFRFLCLAVYHDYLRSETRPGIKIQILHVLVHLAGLSFIGRGQDDVDLHIEIPGLL